MRIQSVKKARRMFNYFIRLKISELWGNWENKKDRADGQWFKFKDAKIMRIGN